MTQEPFHTTYPIFLLVRPEITWRLPGTDAGCGLSTRGLWAGQLYVMKADGVEGTVQDGGGG